MNISSISSLRPLVPGLLLALCLIVFSAPAQAAFELPPDTPRLTVSADAARNNNSLPIAPLLSWLADPAETLDVEQAISALQAGQFKPLSELPVTEAAAVWLCLPVEIAGGSHILLTLDLGKGLPGRVSVLAPSGDDTYTEWENIRRSGTLTLPVAGSGTVPVFIRMEGMPGPWFAPRLLPVAGTEPGGPATWNMLLAGVFGAVWLFCLLASRRDGAYWRPWCSLLAVMCLISMVYGQAITPNGYVPFSGLPGLLSLGVGMLLLPHVGRALMDTGIRAPGLDKALRVCCVIMAVLTLLPLVPGLAWLTRFTPLWPAAAIILLPCAVAGGVKSLPHAPRFFIGCLLAVLAVVPDIVLLCSGKMPVGTPQSGLWGLAAALILFSAATPPPIPAKTEKSAAKIITPLMPNAFLDNQETGRQTILPQPDAPEAFVNTAAEDHNAADNTADEHVPSGHISGNRPFGQSSGMAQPHALPRTEDRLTPAEVEQALHLPLVSLLDALDSFNDDRIPPQLRHEAELVREAGYALSNAAGDPSVALAVSQNIPEPEAVFTLGDLFGRVKNGTAKSIEDTDVSIVFNLPDELDQPFTGDLVRLDSTLRMLIHSAVQAIDEGVIHVGVRQQPDDPAPGHLLFTVRDTGTRIAPQERSLSALYRAWSLAAACKGVINFESDPNQGTLAAFSLQLTPATPDAAAFVHSDPATAALAKVQSTRRQRLMQAIVADDVATSRQQIAQCLDVLPQPPLEARNPMEALHLYRRVPVGLIVMDGDMLEADILEAISGIRAHERESRLSPVPLVVLVNHQLQGRLFVDAGATEMLIKPVSRQTLINTVRRLTSMLDEEEAVTAYSATTPARRSVKAVAHVSLPATAAAESLSENDTPTTAADTTPETLPGSPQAEVVEHSEPGENPTDVPPAEHPATETPVKANDTDETAAESIAGTADVSATDAANASAPNAPTEVAPGISPDTPPEAEHAIDLGAPSVMPPAAEPKTRSKLPRLNIPASRRPVSQKAVADAGSAGKSETSDTPTDTQPADAAGESHATVATAEHAPVQSVAKSEIPAAPEATATADATPHASSISVAEQKPEQLPEQLPEQGQESISPAAEAKMEAAIEARADMPVEAEAKAAPQPERPAAPNQQTAHTVQQPPAEPMLREEAAGLSVLSTSNLMGMMDDDAGLAGLLGEEFTLPRVEPEPQARPRQARAAAAEQKPRQRTRIVLSPQGAKAGATVHGSTMSTEAEHADAGTVFFAQARGFLQAAQNARAAGHLDDVEQAAAHIAENAGQQGLHILERMARCVERAAAARDPLAVSDLMPDLVQAVERAKIQLETGQNK